MRIKVDLKTIAFAPVVPSGKGDRDAVGVAVVADGGDVEGFVVVEDLGSRLLCRWLAVVRVVLGEILTAQGPLPTRRRRRCRRSPVAWLHARRGQYAAGGRATPPYEHPPSRFRRVRVRRRWRCRADRGWHRAAKQGRSVSRVVPRFLKVGIRLNLAAPSEQCQARIRRKGMASNTSRLISVYMVPWWRISRFTVCLLVPRGTGVGCFAH